MNMMYYIQFIAELNVLHPEVIQATYLFITYVKKLVDLDDPAGLPIIFPRMKRFYCYNLLEGSAFTCDHR